MHGMNQFAKNGATSRANQTQHAMQPSHLLINACMAFASTTTSHAPSTPPSTYVVVVAVAVPSPSPLLLLRPLLVAMFLTLCGSSRPKRRQLPSQGSNADDNAINVGEATPGDVQEAVKTPSGPPSASAKFSSEIGAGAAEETVIISGAATHGPIAASFPTQSPKPRLAMSMSMKLPRKLSKIRTGRRREKERSAEDSVWMKAIILGERCKVPCEEDDEEVAFYDDDGNRRRNYRPRTPRSLPASPNISCMRS